MTRQLGRLAGILCALAACGTQDNDSQIASPAVVPSGERVVTLITGDRVVMRGGAPSVTPGPGRTTVRFAISRQHGRVTVIPDDALPLIARGQFDPALFDITGLLGDYSDAELADLPLIVTDYQPGHALLASSLAIGRTMPALRMATAHARQGAALVASSLPAGARLWLDRKRRVALDHSVPQIGGDIAHARGFTGAGVTVAVLDTGIDATHPDLAGKVIAAEDFTGDGNGPADDAGHGTHVASIIAGTGAASGGQLAGVAPDAQLINARVCSENFCPDSILLPALEWAVVEQHAQIVNVSIGGRDTAGVDPVEEAINTLSAQFGALIVVAAGNTGRGPVDSPGAAEAALTVGAIDRDERLAGFSSIGPGISGDTLKPELTAPGVAIVAARARGIPPIGRPVDELYQALSGTSMATPHVAGAAALLLQQHPDWSGAQLKAQLIASAQPDPTLDVFQQGAGRVDIDRATRQLVTSAPSKLDFGIALAPHDDDPPIVRTLRYHNAAATPVTLSLAAQLTSPAGPGSISVTPAALTIPAGGSADATVTVRTDDPALANGIYSGAIVATAGDVRTQTPLTVERAQPTFAVTLHAVASGAPTHATVTIDGERSRQIVEVDGTATVQLLDGHYALSAFLDDAYVVAPRFTPAAGATVTFDRAAAAPVDVDLGVPDLRLALVDVSFFDYANQFLASVLSFAPTSVGQVGPPVPADELTSWIYLHATDAAFESYYLAHVEHGHIPHGWQQRIPRDQLATLRTHHAGNPDAFVIDSISPLIDDGVRGLQSDRFGLQDFRTLPFDQVEHYYGDGIVWDHLSLGLAPTGALTSFAESFTRLAPGQQLHQTWNDAPAGPAFPSLVQFVDAQRLIPSAARRRDTLFLAPSMMTNPGRQYVVDKRLTTHSTLTRNGVPIFESTAATDGNIPVPPGPATYRFSQEVVHAADLYPLSTKARAAWTFQSDTVPGDTHRPLPLLAMRFLPALDDAGTTTARLLLMPIRFERPDGAPPPFVLTATLEASFDDGSHWTRVPLIAFGTHALALIAHLKQPAFVSLRSSATDLDGNRIEQHIDRAYRTAPSRGPRAGIGARRIAYRRCISASTNLLSVYCGAHLSLSRRHSRG